MRWALCIPLIFLFSTLLGQSAELDRLESRFHTAVQRGDKSDARKTFLELFKRDSLRGARLEPQLHGIAYDPENPQAKDLQTMVAVYRVGLEQDPENRIKWLNGRAVFGFRWQDRIPESGAWLLEALEADPVTADLALVDMWWECCEAAWERRKNALGKGGLVEQWGRVDRVLYTREIAGESVTEVLGRRFEMRKKVLEMAGGCKGIAHVAWSNATEAFHAYALCPNAMESKLLAYEAELADDPAWALRLQGNKALNKGDRKAFLSLFERAIANEKLPLLVADLHRQRAKVLSQEGNFRAAQSALKKAIRSAPEWGGSYLELADLYVSSLSSCSLGDFDRKAVYWLALDLVLEGRNKSRGFEKAFNEAFISYSAKMPTIEEAGFRGLSAGDTWPIKCWMNTVTTVKHH